MMPSDPGGPGSGDPPFEDPAPGDRDLDAAEEGRPRIVAQPADLRGRLG